MVVVKSAWRVLTENAFTITKDKRGHFYIGLNSETLKKVLPFPRLVNMWGAPPIGALL